MTIDKFLNLQPTDIQQIYRGTSDCCRCGCKGTYYDSEEPKKIQSLLKLAKKSIGSGATYELGDSYIDITIAPNRSITIYPLS